MSLVLYTFWVHTQSYTASSDTITILKETNENFFYSGKVD